MVKINIDVRPRGMSSAYVVVPFDEGKEALANDGYRIISLQENARLRVQEGRSADVYRYGNWVREGAIYVPNKGAYLTKNSPIMINAKESTDCHRRGQDFYLNDEQVEQSLDGAIELSAGEIPVDEFGSSEITAYAFGDVAQKYGEFLKEHGFQGISIVLPSIQDKPFARPVWFRGLGRGSGLYCDYRGLHNGYVRVRGVQEGAEGTAKNFENYTPVQISKVLNARGISGKLEKEILDGLKI